MPLLWNGVTTIFMNYGFCDVLMNILCQLAWHIDIDECARPADYSCYGTCKNIDGDFDWDCRPGYHSSDPYTEPCTPKFPLAAQISIGTIRELTLFQYIQFVNCVFLKIYLICPFLRLHNTNKSIYICCRHKNIFRLWGVNG
jgi:hypothetical protein